MLKPIVGTMSWAWAWKEKNKTTCELTFKTENKEKEKGKYKNMKSSDAKASKCHLKFSSKMTIFIKLVYLSSVISLKWQLIGNLHCHLSEINELKV